MDAREAIKQTYKTSTMILQSYVSDLTDAELLHRPAPGCNHLAWQIGHLIASEVHLLESVCPGHAVELPAGFVDQHGKENANCDDASKFCSKETYMNLFNQVQEATFTALDTQSDSDLDQPSPESMRSMFPTVGSIFVLIATHPLMHAGQFVPVRRALNKPVLI